MRGGRGGVGTSYFLLSAIFFLLTVVTLIIVCARCNKLILFNNKSIQRYFCERSRQSNQTSATKTELKDAKALVTAEGKCRVELNNI